MPAVKPLSAEEISRVHYLLDECPHWTNGDVNTVRYRLRQLLDEVERTRALLRRFEWSVDDPAKRVRYCAVCAASDRHGHVPGCELAALLGVEPAGDDDPPPLHPMPCPGDDRHAVRPSFQLDRVKECAEGDKFAMYRLRFWVKGGTADAVAVELERIVVALRRKGP